MYYLLVDTRCQRINLKEQVDLQSEYPKYEKYEY